jgi:glyoxalase family protein
MNNHAHISGIHHITAIASSVPENLVFYKDVLDLRLVKKTVNFDDPYTYHLYYGDWEGAPGTIITFFPWDNLPRGKAGAGMVTAIAFSIPTGSFDHWRKRLNAHDIEMKEGERFGDRVIQFEDPHGLPLELIETPPKPIPAVSDMDPIAASHLIMGLHSATAVLNSLEETRRLLTDVLGLVLYDREGDRYRFTMKSDDAFGRFYDVVIDPQAESGRQGGGTVHHIAFRTPTDDEQKYWQKSVRQSGFSVTSIRDRKYFKSIYFHEPGGVLFEIATDPPGFTVDETHDNLGAELQLPDQYEPMRAEIEDRLPDLRSNYLDCAQFGNIHMQDSGI